VFIFRKIQLVAGHIEDPSPLGQVHNATQNAAAKMKQEILPKKKNEFYFSLFFIHGLPVRQLVYCINGSG